MQLRIEGQEADLAPGTVLAVTVQTNDITNPEKVQSSYTNTISLPFTRRNNAILGNANLVGSAEDAPYRKLDVSIEHDGVELLPLPKAYLEEATDGYQLQIFSGAVDFFALLGEKTIQELDLSAFDHVRDIDGVADATDYNRTYADGYVYDLLDRGVPINRGSLYPEHLYPSVFVRAVYAQMMEEAGVKWSFEDATFDKLLLPFSNEKPVHSAAWIEARQYSYPLNNLPALPVHYGYVEVVIKLNITKAPNEGTAAFVRVSLRLNGLNLFTHRYDVTETGEQESKVTFLVNPLFNLADVALVVDQENLTTGTFSSGAYYSTDSTIKFNYQEEAVYRSSWEVAPNLPDISQKDFFKMVLALFNLMPNYDPYSNTMHLVPMQQLEANKAIALDWSDKLMNLDSQQLKYRFGSFAQKSWFRYSEGAADGFIPVDDTQLPFEADVLTLPVAASETVAGLVSVPVLEEEQKALGGYETAVDTVAGLDNVNVSGSTKRVLVRDAVTGNNYTRNETTHIYKGGAIYVGINLTTSTVWFLAEVEYTYKQANIEPRLTLWNPDNRQTVLLRDNNQGSGRSVSMVVSTFSGLDWATILQERYSVLQGILDKAKGLTAQFLLSPADVQNHDASVPIYLECHGSYFYCNKIIEFTGEGPTTVELWRL